MPFPGYACVPYMHDDASAKLRDHWIRSSNVGGLFFATATFSPECKLYFLDFANHYLVARFHDSEKASKDMGAFVRDTAFVFVITSPMLDRQASGDSFISFYHAAYAPGCDRDEMATILHKHTLVTRAGRGHLKILSKSPPKFPFPYQDIVALEAVGEKSPQSLNQYCEKTKAEMMHHGISLSRMFNMSVLENLK